MQRPYPLPYSPTQESIEKFLRNGIRGGLGFVPQPNLHLLHHLRCVSLLLWNILE